MPRAREMPSYQAFFNPILKAPKILGGSGSVDELNTKVIESLDLPDELSSRKHDPEAGNETEIEYRLAWARTYLKKFGLIDNSIRAIWALTKKADSVHEVDPDVVVKFVRGLKTSRGKSKVNGRLVEEIPEEDIPTEAEAWRAELYRLLTTELEPAAFERLVQRLLRESGFVQVEVTGRTGDGGIDGKGIARIHGLMSFHVVFQCKRYKGSVTPSEIRDFRGAMVGRADKGMFITTGSFTRDAFKEAIRDGASPIDLLDGEALADKLKELHLGVTTRLIESVTVDPAWFRTI